MRRGFVSLEVSGGVVTVLNLMGATADSAALPVYAAWRAVEKRGAVLVDFHSDAAWEKMIFEAPIVLGAVHLQIQGCKTQVIRRVHSLEPEG